MVAKKLYRALIMGAPASGKGTISERIITCFNLNHLACGDILRKNIELKTPLGLEATKYIAKGQLVPDPLVIKCILSQIKELVASRPESPSWLLDGFPRTLEQAKELAKQEQIDAVLNLVVPHEVIIDRVKGRLVHLPSGRVYNTEFNVPKIPNRDNETGELLVQRPDDNPEIVRKRLEVYDAQTKPLIEHYRKQGILYEFEGRTSNEIWPKVQQYLEHNINTKTMLP